VHAQKKRIGVGRQIPQNVAASKALHFVQMSTVVKSCSCEHPRVDRRWCWKALKRRKPVALLCFLWLVFWGICVLTLMPKLYLFVLVEIAKEIFQEENQENFRKRMQQIDK